MTVECEGRVLRCSTGHCQFVPNYRAVEKDNDRTDSELSYAVTCCASAYFCYF